MTALRNIALLLVVTFTGCSLFHRDDPAQVQAAPRKKKSSFWPLGDRASQDATAYLEYQRVRSESDKYALLVRNTHLNKAIEGDIRTTIETGPGESKVDTTHFALAPNETKKLLVYPKTTPLTYEVTALFKE